MAATTRLSKGKEKTIIKKAKKKSLPSASDKKSAMTSAFLMLSSELLSSGSFNSGLPSFVTRGLDTEQIWQQCELRNNHKMGLSACTRNAVLVQTGKPKAQKKQLCKNNVSKKEDSKVESDSGDSESSEDNEVMLNSIKRRLEEQDASEDDDFSNFGESEDDNDLDFDFELEKEMTDGGDESSTKPSKHKKSKKRTSIVDDKFFKLGDMEQFLESEDAKEEKRRKQEDDNKKSDDDSDESDEDEDGDIDMFESDDSNDDFSSQAKYADFFDPPDEDSKLVHKKSPKVLQSRKDSEGEDNGDSRDEDDELASDEEKQNDTKEDSEMGTDDDEGDEEMEGSEDEEEEMEEEDEGGDDASKVQAAKNKKVSFEQDLLQSESDGDEGDFEPSNSKDDRKSTFELRQEQLRKKAGEMEELSLKEASWELTGEASASKRPENSLLETVLDFQHTTTAAPVITDDTTKSLEDYIKQRIRDKTFDDVERKEKPKEDVLEYKKRIVLDQEKSKLSLGELYEQEFLKQQQQDDEEVKADPECEAIEKDLTKLFKQLDALSNFRYTPLKPGTEVKIVVNTPAISMEEVAPVATTDADLLAPEEVHEKKRGGELKADDERDSTDKKRARRQKKKEKRERRKAKESREKLVQKLKPGLGNKYSKAKALKDLEQLAKSDQSVKMIKGERQKLGSSTSFFSQLQDEVQTNVRAKQATKASKKKKVTDASKLML